VITQTYKARCGLEHQYRIEPNGHILAAIARKGIRWEVRTIVTTPGGSFTLAGEGRTKTQAIRIRRRHLNEVRSRLETTGPHDD
jgi:hypothetical protein